MDDFQDASKRHLDDAELLVAQQPPRLANASHLFGVSAECSLKAIVQKNNAAATFRGRSGHIPFLFVELTNIAPAIAGNPALVSGINSIKNNFTTWRVEQRYLAQVTFTGPVVAQETIGARQAQLLMNNHLQGLI